MMSTSLWRKFTDLEQEISILFTMYKAGTSHSPGIVQEATKIYRDNVLPMYVPETIEFPRSFEKQMPIINHNPAHAGSQSYRELAGWLINA